MTKTYKQEGREDIKTQPGGESRFRRREREQGRERGKWEVRLKRDPWCEKKKKISGLTETECWRENSARGINTEAKS